MQSPSLKKLGKRPELREVESLDKMGRTTTPLSQPSPAVVQQKRILPSRVRRGGPGVGTCGVDILIIDTERRTRETKPVIHPTQRFFLTTHSKAVPSPPEMSAVDGEATGSYFDNPEVKAAYLAQKAIQVPEFSPLPDDAVGGRLRARAEEEGPETSDAAYINRHRKYETFEKRQRRREKEKLVHEQYKLKERIEQLKGMDVSAFGGGGEARRREMLDVAEGLEMRYAVLLPPDPKRTKKNENKRKRSEGAQAGTTPREEGAVEDHVVGRSPVQDTLRPASTGPKSYQANRPNTRLRLQSQPPPQPQPMPMSTSVPGSPAISVAVAASGPECPQQYVPPSVSTTPSAREGPIRSRDANGPFLFLTKAEGSQTPSPTLPTIPEITTPMVNAPPPPRKRQRMDTHPKRHQSPDAFPPVTSSVLLQIAARKAAQPQARQTSRTTLAFGFRVPPEVEDPHFYEVPGWLISQGELEGIHEMRTRSTTRSPSPNHSFQVPNGLQNHAGTGITTGSAPDAPTPLPPLAPNGVKANTDGQRPALPTSSIRDENMKSKDEDVLMEG